MTIGETFLSAFLQVLFEKLLSTGVILFSKLWGGDDLGKTIKLWKRQLKMMEALLDDADQKQYHSKAVKTWLEEFQDLAYDMEDILDDFAYEAQLHELRNSKEDDDCDTNHPGFLGSASNMVQNITDGLSNLFNVSNPGSIQSRIDDLTERLQDLQSQNLGLVAAHAMQQYTLQTEALRSRRESTSLVGEPVVFGRDDIKKDFITLLLKDEPSYEKFVVMPIVGRGGIGKTTLAQCVYNDEQVQSHFNLKAWVCVSDVFDVKRITTEIINSATHSKVDFSTLNLAQEKLMQVLSGKTFFIVLDDIWSENYDDWSMLQIPFRYGVKGSRIVMTTRIDKIAKMMFTNNSTIISLEGLLNDDCWRLFQQHTNEDTELAEMKDLIVRKCNGLPLAAKTLGGLLKSITEKSQRLKILESNVWGEESSVLPVIRLSYLHLPSYLKRVFAYCSILPKDYEFTEREVVLLWMAQGFLPENQSESMESIGHNYFLDLVSRSLFEQSPYGGGEFIMHDIIHDLAQLAAGDVCFTMGIDLCASPPTTSSLSSCLIHRRRRRRHHHHQQSSSSSLCFPISQTKENSHEKLPCRMAGIDRKGMTSDICSGTMIYEPVLEEGVFRFDCSTDNRNAAFPSLSFMNPKVRDMPLMSEKLPSYVPTFECTMGQQIVLLRLPVGTSFYGTGEVSGQLERTGKRVFTWNTDAWGYGPSTTSLYQSHPWVLAVLPTGETLGVLADTTQRCEIDLRKGSTIKFVAPLSYPVITFGPFSSPTHVLVSLSHAIGTVFMPPKWSLGYHQCRWSYASDKRVLEVAKTFRKKDIPCDVIWMDIDYMDDFRCFTFDHERFSDPNSLVNDLHLNGFKAIWMLDPGIKHEKGYFVHDSGSKSDVWIKTADGKPFVGEVWPGPCVFPDFTHSKARSWWADLVKDFISNGVDGIWNDMNEPAIFKVVTKTMPESNIHDGDLELGGCQNHSYYHNVYGMLMARSTYEGMKLANEHKRPFVLTRAGFIGSQRNAATWTGDNLSTWEHLHMSVPMVLQLGLSGQPLSGPDIGGFAGNATPKLFGRWMGIGAMFPFCRGHSEMGTDDHEPWAFGEECEEVCRLALKRRYRLIPHIYTLFYLAHTVGSPVASPSFFADPKDIRLRTVENSFLLGPLLIHSSTLKDQGTHQIQPFLPKGIWLSFDFNDSHPDLPALYLKGGSIIPLGPPHQHVGEANPTDDLILLVALDEHGKAEGVLFEDDGDGYEFTRGNYLLTYYTAELHCLVVNIKVSNTKGSWKRPKRRLHVKLLLGGGAMIDSWATDGEEFQITMPSEQEVSDLVLESQKQYQTRIETAKCIPDIEHSAGKKGTELSRTPVELKGGDWFLRVVPWIGGRIFSMEHHPTGIQWLHSRIEINGYEEYSGTEYRSPGCTEEYTVIERDLQQAGEEEALKMEGDIGGGLVLERCISIPKTDPSVVQINSRIIGRNVGAGSGGFSRLVCLRVHPTFALLHPTGSFVSFTAVDGSKHEIQPESNELSYEGDQRPNGEWVLVDKCLGVGLVNRFDIKEVYKCLIHWGTGTVNLELWSEQRPVSQQSPLSISHVYEVRMI